MKRHRTILILLILTVSGICGDDKAQTRAQLLRLCGVPEYLGEEGAKSSCLSCIGNLNLESYDKNSGALPQGLTECFEYLPKSFRNCPSEEKPKECVIKTFKRFMGSVKNTFLERWKNILTKTEKEQFQEVRAMKYMFQEMKEKLGEDNQLVGFVRQCWTPSGSSPSPDNFEEDDGLNEFMKRSISEMNDIDLSFDVAVSRTKRVARPKSKDEIKNELTRNHIKMQFRILQCTVHNLIYDEPTKQQTKEFLSSFTGNVPVELVRGLFMQEHLGPR